MTYNKWGFYVFFFFLSNTKKQCFRVNFLKEERQEATWFPNPEENNVFRKEEQKIKAMKESNEENAHGVNTNILSQRSKTIIYLTCIPRSWRGGSRTWEKHCSLRGGNGMRPRPVKEQRWSLTSIQLRQKLSNDVAVATALTVFQNMRRGPSRPWPGKWSHCSLNGPGWWLPWKRQNSSFLKIGMESRVQTGLLLKLMSGLFSLLLWHNNSQFLPTWPLWRGRVGNRLRKRSVSSWLH